MCARDPSFLIRQGSPELPHALLPCWLHINIVYFLLAATLFSPVLLLLGARPGKAYFAGWGAYLGILYFTRAGWLLWFLD